MITLCVLGLAACAHDNSPEAQCERQAYDDPAVRSIYRSEQGNYANGATRAALQLALRQATVKCMRQKGLAPPSGVEPVRRQSY
jgi:hypothetical protein